MAFILDWSVVMAWCFEDETDDYADWILGTLDVVDRILVPSIWTAEIVNVIAVGERRKRLRRDESAQFLGLLDRVPIEIDSRSSYATTHDVLNVARDYDISAYDACYIELAMRTRLPLATLDMEVRNVATCLELFQLDPPILK